MPTLTQPLGQPSSQAVEPTEFTAVALRSWLAALRQTEPTTASQAVLNALATLNEQVLDKTQRLVALNHIRRPALALFRAYDSPAFQRRLADTGPRSQLTTQLTDILRLLAEGYRACAAEEISSSESKRPLLTALYLAMEQTTYALVHGFRSHGPLPPSIHLDLNQLYQQGEQLDLLEAPVRLERKTTARKTLGMLYRQTMLLAVADPFGFGPGEVGATFAYLRRYAAFSRIVALEDDERRDGLFIIDLSADSPPLPPSTRVGIDPSPSLRFFDVNPVLRAAVHDQLQRSRSRAHQLRAEQGKRLLQQITPRCRASRARRETRKRVARPVRIALGLMAVHQLAWALSARQRQSGSTATDTPLTTAPNSQRERLPTVETWSIIDESNSGYRLRQRCDQIDHLRVGDLVGLLEPLAGRSAPLCLGIVRWQRGAAGQQVSMGIEKLPRPAFPASALLDKCGEAVELPCFFFAQRDEATRPSLVTTAGSYASGDPIAFAANGRQASACVRRILSETPHLVHLELEKASQPELNKNAEPESG